MANSNPITEWWVRLSGDDQDLRDACEAFECSEICRVERDEDCNYYVKAQSLNELVDATEVMTRAENLVARINGSLMALLVDFEPIKVDAPVSIHENGGRGRYILAGSGQIKLRGGRAKLTVCGMPDETMPRSDAEKWLAWSETNDHLGDMLTFLSRGDNWFDLYKAWEMVRELSSGKVEKDGRFCHTANWYRHSSAKVKKPPVPMELNIARKYIRKLVRRVLMTYQPLE